MYRIIRPLLFTIEPEKAHNFTLRILKNKAIVEFLKFICKYETKSLEKNLYNIKLKNPIGLAAGLDKEAEAIDAFAAMGFGFIEVGTITPLPQEGNPKPRLFRLKKQQSLINSMGFNNSGVDIIKKNIQKHISNIPLGINMGKNKSTPIDKAKDDYLKVFKILHNYGDYFVVNVSSPNTPNLRKLQQQEYLDDILYYLQKENERHENRKPILVKISPDLSPKEIDNIIFILKKNDLNGIIATNTTNDMSIIQKNENSIRLNGGISGKLLQKKSTEIIKYIRQKAKNFIIIGVGGINDYRSAIEKMIAGADFIQLLTGLIYKGPCLIKQIKKQLEHLTLNKNQ